MMLGYVSKEKWSLNQKKSLCTGSTDFVRIFDSMLFLFLASWLNWHGHTFLNQCWCYAASKHTKMTVSMLATRLYGVLRGTGDFLGKRTWKDVMCGSDWFLSGTAILEQHPRANWFLQFISMLRGSNKKKSWPGMEWGGEAFQLLASSLSRYNGCGNCY
jgi:hypothetical protein